MATKTYGKPLTGTAAQGETAKAESQKKPSRNLRWWSYTKSPNIVLNTKEGIRIFSYMDARSKRIVVVEDTATRKWLLQVGLKKDGSNTYVKSEVEAISDAEGAREARETVQV